MLGWLGYAFGARPLESHGLQDVYSQPEPACPRGLRLCGMYDIFFHFQIISPSHGSGRQPPEVTLSMSEIG